jgi:protein-L-isoaspartate O-methyltransferase
MVQTVYEYCLDLVTAIERKLGRSLASSVRDALLQVPRHLFVSHYYEHSQVKRAPSVSDKSAWEE